MTHSSSTSNIFVSYRRQDTRDVAGRIYDHLVEVFGEDRVFMDVDTLQPGQDYLATIEDNLDRIDIFLAVIGSQWLAITAPGGEARLQDPKDLLRLEMAKALERGIRVVPILVEGAMMPAASDLPSDLAQLARLHAFKLNSERFRNDIQLLVSSLIGEETEPSINKRRSAAHGFKLAAAYTLMSILLAGSLLCFFVAALMWGTSSDGLQELEPFFYAGLLSTGSSALILLLMGWIGEVRMLWVLGAVTLAALVISLFAASLPKPWGAGCGTAFSVGIAAASVESLRRMRHMYD